jgi:hypothetical protein
VSAVASAQRIRRRKVPSSATASAASAAPARPATPTPTSATHQLRPADMPESTAVRPSPRPASAPPTAPAAKAAQSGSTGWP